MLKKATQSAQSNVSWRRNLSPSNNNNISRRLFRFVDTITGMHSIINTLYLNFGSGMHYYNICVMH